MTDVSIPSNLGTGHRTPGFDPYLFYVKDSVFLRFTGRAYRNETEKWQVSLASSVSAGNILISRSIFTDWQCLYQAFPEATFQL